MLYRQYIYYIDTQMIAMYCHLVVSTCHVGVVSTYHVGVEEDYNTDTVLTPLRSREDIIPITK